VTSRSYYMLITSLPALPPHFEVDRNPVPRERFEERLKLLHNEDTAVLESLLDFFEWDRQPLDRTDEEVVEHYDRLMATIGNRLIRQIINDRMEVRTIVAGLRLRKAELVPPVGPEPWATEIRRNWKQPDFRLQVRHPWVTQFRELIDAGNILEAERLQLSTSWTYWSRLAQRYHFTFESVVLYLARWEIIDRWTSRDAEQGRERFEQLIAQTLGEHGKLIH
jgi:uncharacterized protein DUF2764